MSCYSSKHDVCCPISCAGIDLFPKQLILIKRCTSIRNPCDGTTEATLFATEISPTSTQLPSGMITIMNSSPDCTMNVDITDSSGLTMITIDARSADTIQVDGLISCILTCTGPNTDDFCTGTFEADLQYTINK
ncbi:S-Ena type endospore appendage [Chengkuizengella axinellae]|uniref:DUF3992 domain-containing protein n=1 Tax=Chengkuizengella axinellae TaxID=3064388 RepID=A0ABT9IV84_9BACL|nr:S-Ena type endospore appendage [Chengkuizengella sp. 2205SS18-9]MDP5273271.1 hypothetical protein [Chengkuizengella sp. 2205SS18-9]